MDLKVRLINWSKVQEMYVKNSIPNTDELVCWRINEKDEIKNI